MNNESIGLGIVFSVILIWIIGFVIKVVYNHIKDEKSLYEANIIKQNVLKAYNEFKDKMFLTALNEINWYYYVINEIETVINNEFQEKIMENGDEVLERYRTSYKPLMEYIDKCHKDSKVIKTEISYNISHWYKSLDDVPVFFVLENIGGIGENLYCHSSNLRFEENSNNLIGIVFSNKKTRGVLMTISPKNYKMRPMSQYEFYNKYLLSRQNILDFYDIRKSISYENYLKEEFLKNNK